MDVSGIKTARLNVSEILARDINEAEKSKIVNQLENTLNSERIIEELSGRYNSENIKKAKPQLSGKPTGKQNDDKTPAKRISINELFSRLSDDLSGEQIVNSEINKNINNNLLKNIWTESKESELSKSIGKYSDVLLAYVDELADYYFSVINDCDENSDDVSFFFTDDKNIKISNKCDFLIYFNNKLGLDILRKGLSDKSGDCKDKTVLLKKLLDDVISLPKVKGKEWIIEPQKLVSLKSELTMLDNMAGILASAKECLSAAQSLISMNNKNTTEYNNSLTVLMGKLSDLRDEIAQRKLDNDRELARLQQAALQAKTDKDAADIAEKIKEAELLQAIFKWLGVFLIALIAVLTALTGGVLATALAVVVALMTAVSEIVKAAGGPDIMAKIMEPVTKLIEVIQKFVKNFVVDLGKAAGMSPDALKEIEKKMEIIAMAVAIVVVAALFMAASSAIGSIAGNIIGKFASEAAIKVAITQIQATLISIIMTSTIVNGISTVSNAALQFQAARMKADMEFDLELQNRITELMNIIMETFTESHKDLIALNEKISKYGSESFQRMKSIIQQSQLAV
ncbi:hypothetical protein Q4R69_05700 [Morganella morganii subsp. sibonii]